MTLCSMIQVFPSMGAPGVPETQEVPCPNTAAFRDARDPEHFVCRLCYERMVQHDAELVAGLEPFIEPWVAPPRGGK